MSVQTRAIRIARDVIGIVLDWNDRNLSDKEAMKEITRSLMVHKENQDKEKKFEKKEGKVLPEKNKAKSLEIEEKKEIIVEEKEDEGNREEEKTEKIIEEKESKKLTRNVRFGKKLVPPLIISAFFILVVFGIVNPYDVVSNFEVEPSTEDKSIQLREVPMDDTVIRSEQFLEIPSNSIEKIQNSSEIILEP